jgi:hypothetical protein
MAPSRAAARLSGKGFKFTPLMWMQSCLTTPSSAPYCAQRKPMPAQKLSSIVRPTPRDIDVAQACTPQPVVSIAAQLGLNDDEYDAYGKYMAKVRETWTCRLSAPDLAAPPLQPSGTAWPPHACRSAHSPRCASHC